jgi:hypothetical protein
MYAPASAFRRPRWDRKGASYWKESLFRQAWGWVGEIAPAGGGCNPV